MNKTLAVLAALGAFVTACSGDPDSADRSGQTDRTGRDGGLFGDGDEQDGESERGSGRVERGIGSSDGEQQLAVETTDEIVEDDVEDDVEASESTQATSTAATSTGALDAPTAGESDSDGGRYDSDRDHRHDDDHDDDHGNRDDGNRHDDDDSDEARFEDNTFRDYGYRDFVEADVDPLSTFALDVDTGSYAVTRRWIDEGTLPPIEAVRPEEFVNAFRYDYRAPQHGLDITIDGGPSPFDRDNYLVRIGVQGEIVDDHDRGPAALTFVVDTSGSMDRDDRLGLVKRSLEILVEELDADDTVAIVTYDDSAGVVLAPTPVSERDTILDAIDDLRPGGSTNLEDGLRTGYGLAREVFRHDGINRVVLASDGVANVGITDPDELARMISEDAGRGIDLVTIGFGMGNFNDVTMEQLADQGDGFYAYVDTDDEAERLFEHALTSTLLTIAKNAKIQVEFDPEVVEAYRLIGFENRGVHDREFRDDSVDAGELGAGHQVTAIYEIELARRVDADDRDDLGRVFLRWEDPATGEVEEIDDDVRRGDIEPVWEHTPDDFQLATVVAAFAEVMRDNPYAEQIDIDDLYHEADRLAEVLDDRSVDELADLIDHAAHLR